MSIWDTEEYTFKSNSLSRRRDVTKFGISPAKHAGMNGRLLIPARAKAKLGQFVRYIETPEGIAFRISDRGDYKVCLQNPTSEIFFAQAPYALCRFAKDKAISIEVEDYAGGYLCRFSQFK